VIYKIGGTRNMHHWLWGMDAPVSAIWQGFGREKGRRAHRSSSASQLLVPRAATSIIIIQRSVFSIFGHLTWNGLSLEMPLIFWNNANTFYTLVKTNL